MRTNLILSLVLVSFLVSLASAAYTTTPYGQYPVCTTSAGVVGYAEPLPASATTSEKRSFYYDSATNKDSVEIMARIKPADPLKFELTIVDRALGATTKEITRSTTGVETIHSLLGPVLITKTVTAGVVSFTAYYYLSGAALTGSDLPLANFGTTPWASVDLKLVSYDDSAAGLDIYAFWTDGTTHSGVYKNTIADKTVMAASTSAASTAKGTDLAAFPAPASTYGGRNLIINTVDGKCYKADATPKFVADTSCDITFVAGSTWSVFNLLKFTTVVVSTKATAAGNIQYSYQAAITTGKQTLATSAAAYRTFTDDIRNVLVLGAATGQDLAWISVQVATPSVGLVKYSLTAGAHDVKLSGAVNVALANHRAFFLNPGFITVVENNAANLILMKQIDVSTTLTSAGSATDFKVSTKCTEPSFKVSRFTCFATTLNCISTTSDVGNSVIRVEPPGSVVV